MIHDEIVTYEVAKVAKEMGFNEKCNFYYQKGVISTDGCFNRYNKGVEYICSAPTQSLLQRWLREEKGIIVIPYYRSVLRMWSATYELTSPCKFKDLRKCFKTYELALEDALKYALENLV